MKPYERIAAETGWLALAVWDDDGGFRPGYTMDDESPQRVLLAHATCFRDPVPRARPSWAAGRVAVAASAADVSASGQRRDAARGKECSGWRAPDGSGNRARVGEVFLDFDPVCPDWPPQTHRRAREPHHLPW